MDDVLTLVLAGGVGQRLYPLTRHRAKPAVPFGGIYRLIDFTLSNCINSGCRRILVLVQYKSLSLARHVSYAWNIVNRQLGEYLEVVPPQQRVSDNWYLGTADAIYQNIYSIDEENPAYVLILSGDHIYKMNYRKMIEYHRQTGADVTVGTIAVPYSEATRFGVAEIDSSMRIIGFEEKPEQPKGMPNLEGYSLASMGIYVFNKDVLSQACVEDARRSSSHDFGKDILPRLILSHHVQAYLFEDENRKEIQYWRDVGTIDSYWEANMDLVAVDPQFNLYDRAWPIRTQRPLSPPAKFVFANEGSRFGVAVDSIVSSGSIVSGGMVKRSVLSPDVRINSYSHVEESILFHGVRVGRHCRIRRAIIEKYVEIPPNTSIGYDPEADAQRYHVSEGGIIVVERQDFQ